MATPPEYRSLVEKLEQLGIDISLLGRFVQGTDVETVLLGGVATPSLRKLARDIDERESRAAQDVIDTATEQITLEGNLQYERVHTEGVYQYERILVEGQAQRREQKKQADQSLTAIVQAGEKYLLAVTGEGKTQLAAVEAQGATERERLTALSTEQLARLLAEGDAQFVRMRPAVDAAIVLAEQHTEVMAAVARLEVRLNQLADQIIQLQDPETGGPVTAGKPEWNPTTGAYTGPVTVGTSTEQMGDAGVLFLVADGAHGDESGDL